MEPPLRRRPRADLAARFGVRRRLAIARPLDDGGLFAGIDAGETFLAIRIAPQQAPPPIGSRVRVAPAARDRWRFAEVQPLGAGIDLRFDEHGGASDDAWVDTLRSAVPRLRTMFEEQRERLASRGAQLGALQEPSPLEEIWREHVSAIGERVMTETDYTDKEAASLAKARARGARSADEEERRILAARKKRYTERLNEAVAAFREERWPALREQGLAETQRYSDYRTEMVRLEDALMRLRALSERAVKAMSMLDAIAKAGFRVAAIEIPESRLEEAAYADDVLRSVELLHAAIPVRATLSAASFSAYRAPTAGPSVIPPRY
ncbi:hypothetical protein WPS_28880 [Vulcanimicrobium alpinum]|uniref:Uncharacterized protein n=1 Tax=Vulcanimicrobium alpinum TaxID=3016050 RepID=A0AAN1Y0A6_UNVUL|nr:hypothetical protein [Vulcanimicrobium alpinum]BDE07612.1 hypothetical protein WPS_28880 [Vulcanimicrobium alpinum]